MPKTSFNSIQETGTIRRRVSIIYSYKKKDKLENKIMKQTGSTFKYGNLC